MTVTSHLFWLDAFEKYKSATGAVMDSTTGLLSITAEQYENLKSLFFEIGGTTYELVPNAQIWPRSLNEQIGGAANGIYLVITDIGTPSGHGLDFMNGYTFLYVITFLENALANLFAVSASTLSMTPRTNVLVLLRRNIPTPQLTKRIPYSTKFN